MRILFDLNWEVLFIIIKIRLRLQGRSAIKFWIAIEANITTITTINGLQLKCVCKILQVDSITVLLRIRNLIYFACLNLQFQTTVRYLLEISNNRWLLSFGLTVNFIHFVTFLNVNFWCCFVLTYPTKLSTVCISL